MTTATATAPTTTPAPNTAATDALPVLLSIPHGGTRVPPELRGRVCITDRDRFDDSDPFAAQIYDLGSRVRRVITTDIARAFVDLNRPPDALPPDAPDGLIKSTTCHGRPIYIDGMAPDRSMMMRLIDAHYEPYHDSIIDAVSEPGLRLCLDCHTMASKAPEISPDDQGSDRPAFCLSNRRGKSSPDSMMAVLADCMSDAFAVDRSEIRLNDPFVGGHITATYGNRPVPWIQVEMSRRLYLDGLWFDNHTLAVDQSRLLRLNEMFAEALGLFFARADLPA